MTAPARILTDEDLAAEIGMSRDYVRGKCRAGDWPHTRFGTRIRFTSSQLEQILALHQVAPAPAAPAETVPVEESAAIAWGRSTRSTAQRARGARQRAQRSTA